MKNGDARFERLIRIKAIDQAKVNGHKGAVRDLIMIAVANGRILFAGEEQGTRKYKDETLLLIGINSVRETQVWLHNEHGKSFEIKNNLNHKMSVPEIQQQENYYGENLGKMLTEEINEMKTVKKWTKFFKGSVE